MITDPWFPLNFKIDEDNTISEFLYEGEHFQICKLSNGSNLLCVDEYLVSLWLKLKLVDYHIWTKKNYLSETIFLLVTRENYILAPIKSFRYRDDKCHGLAFARALRETRGIIPDLHIEDGIFVEKLYRLLPLSENRADIDDDLLLGKWLTGGVGVSVDMPNRIEALTKTLTKYDIKEIKTEASLDEKTIKKRESKVVKVEKFTLPGASYLEKFFHEKVIDVVQNPVLYKKFGIDFPAGIILYGVPGSGKTYSVEKLAEYLGWPIFTIDSKSIASPYIHDTPLKISKLFHAAFDEAPAIVIIDEMEAYLSDRKESQNHRVEEVGEFLKLIPEARHKSVLVIAMTNLYENIDPAVIRAGRFDHKIEVLLPSRDDVVEMFESALSNLPIASDVNFNDVIDSLVNKPRSDVAFVINESARLAALRRKDFISMEEFFEVCLQKNITIETRKIGF
jgi:hypothetical protein